MDDSGFRHAPAALEAILADTAAHGFTMASEPKTGALLAALAAAKPGGRLLELGTGTGLGTAWLLSGMDAASHLDTIDTDPKVIAIARTHLEKDARVTFHLMDEAEFIEQLTPVPVRFDLRRCVAGKVHASGRDAVAPARRRHLLRRRSAAPGQLAGGARGEGSSAHRRHRASIGIRDGEVGVGVGTDDCCAHWLVTLHLHARALGTW